ncbi:MULTISPECIES: flagellar biosynthetic protein FliQ [Bacillus cereus group]|uniref:Export protein FliQ family 3 n=1 Tax=Bacillus cytotoxicus (strain DSM 22905 / CIP 110041 / 391-98 / NVH 391-98) TaxID=315749 RepID=A7GNJ5_BACCN|nr:MULTISPECIES: flagellar biosynthetic protein FliQ [Bacillus cereus group]ABS21703.1 export protein FliQ family 3 [Bacillus cytotoxicus NVH 391-98]AWC28319.1 flagellar export apparatus protein FliQ [Bacillus cytotoxicus]AWC40296.1 flagellar export apparatus protein FliQ [Bacillus cytotoxicus]AWC44401.1 flagellar export apparatus protein FliQ [Bacillus cytotoxicus]AWC48227.1 flagellar export apparatus protein FliQ [Bacillus cytotoxicus]
MNTSPIIDIFQSFFYKGVMILLPIAGVSMVVVVVIAVIMAMMQIQEQTLTFLPKMASIVLVIIILGPWMFQELTTLILDLFDKIPSLLRSY